MKHDFSTALREATALVRAGKPLEATSMIRSALGGKDPAPTIPGAPAEAPRATPSRRMKIGRGLRETLAGLSARRQPGPRPDAAEQLPDLPPGASFEAGTYACAAGTRDYRLYVPASARQGPAGLLLMLHGCTQSPVDFAAGTDMNRLAEQHGMIVLYAGQSRAANMNSCWNWFAPGDQVRGAGEPAILAGMTEEVIRKLDVPRDRVFVAGLSAGAAMAVILGHGYGDLFCAVGAHSGLPYGAASDVPSAFAAMAGNAAPTPQPGARSRAPAPTIVFHGTSDGTVSPLNGRRVADAAHPGGAEIIDSGTMNGRSYSRASMATRDGRPHSEFWQVEGLGHAWSGGKAAGSYTDPAGPDASAEMLRFFLAVAADRDRDAA